MSKAVTLKSLLSAEDPSAIIAELSFEKGLSLVEELVSQVESGEITLDGAVTSYERGTLVLEHLKKLLSGAEAKLEKLK